MIYFRWTNIKWLNDSIFKKFSFYVLLNFRFRQINKAWTTIAEWVTGQLIFLGQHRPFPLISFLTISLQFGSFPGTKIGGGVGGSLSS